MQTNENGVMGLDRGGEEKRDGGGHGRLSRQSAAFVHEAGL